MHHRRPVPGGNILRGKRRCSVRFRRTQRVLSAMSERYDHNDDRGEHDHDDHAEHVRTAARSTGSDLWRGLPKCDRQVPLRSDDHDVPVRAADRGV